MKVKFIADDGSLFSSEEECKAYEDSLNILKEKKKAYEEALKDYYKKYNTGSSLLWLAFGGK